MIDLIDRLISDLNVVGLSAQTELCPLDGPGSVISPPTYAGVVYNISPLNEKGDENICTIDSIPSQANRVEEFLTEERYTPFMPNIVIKIGDKELNLLRASHRIADALVRCSDLEPDATNALQFYQQGNAEALAKLSPTSIIFGAWDSRNTKVKIPRLITMRIDAFNVKKVCRSTTYTPAIKAQEIFPKDSLSKDDNFLSEIGLNPCPVVDEPNNPRGGVIVNGKIILNRLLAVEPLRLLYCTDKSDTKKTHLLRRYLLALALVAISRPSIGYLRQGCVLTLDPSNAIENEFFLVQRSGQRTALSISHEDAIELLKTASKEFGVGPDRIVNYKKELTMKELAQAKAKAKEKKKSTD